ncbi:hypothetical protein [Pseudomonas edaphica]|uniref:hypothetical protein n=1 Tax=Pseudomonas edaphica TaxID=2006980 RepID=UPI003D122FCA
MIFVKRDTVTEPESLTKVDGPAARERARAEVFYAAASTKPAPKKAPAKVKAKAKDTKKSEKPKKKTFNFKAYREKDVKEKLEALFNKKCAYCESSYEAVMSAQVEHFRPKNRVSEDVSHTGYWWLASEWTNLLPSCIHCNGSEYHKVEMFNTEHPYMQAFKKGSYKLGKYDSFPIGGARARVVGDDLEHENAYLINPTKRNPDNHLQWVVERGLSLVAPVKTGQDWDPHGLATYKVFGLNRINLVDVRTELMLKIQKQLLKADKILKKAATEPLGGFFDHLCEEAQDILDDLEKLADPSKPYSAMVRKLIDNDRARLVAEFQAILAKQQKPPRKLKNHAD